MRYTDPEDRKYMMREMRRQRKRNAPSRVFFWPLFLILGGLVFFLTGQNIIAANDWWKAIAVGVGVIFIIEAIVYSFSPATRPYILGRAIPGGIILVAGLSLFLGQNVWWPLALVTVGVALLVGSWFLQKEIQKRMAVQATLQESETKYRYIIDNANSIIIEIDARGNVIFSNKFSQDFFGYSENELKGKDLLAIIASNAMPATQTEALINKITKQPGGYYQAETENNIRNGTKAWIVWTYKPIYNESNELIEILCTGINRTEQKKSEELLAQELKEKTAIEERNRLARDLHDAVSQTLFSASLIADVLPRLWEKNREEALKRLEEIRRLTRGALAEMRTLLFELRPAALADAGLPDLLKQLTESLNTRAPLSISLAVYGSGPIPTDVKIAFYRIAQEALNNIIRHSKASQAQVNLNFQTDGLLLSIADNGQGFDIPRGSGFGLGNMKERASQIGAKLNIESEINKGTEIVVIWEMNSTETPK